MLTALTLMYDLNTYRSSLPSSSRLLVRRAGTIRLGDHPADPSTTPPLYHSALCMQVYSWNADVRPIFGLCVCTESHAFSATLTDIALRTAERPSVSQVLAIRDLQACTDLSRVCSTVRSSDLSLGEWSVPVSALGSTESHQVASANQLSCIYTVLCMPCKIESARLSCRLLTRISPCPLLSRRLFVRPVTRHRQVHHPQVLDEQCCR